MERTCSGDCLKCSPQQRLYCSTQMCLNIMTIVQAIEKRITSMEGIINEIRQPSDELVSPPIKETKTE